MDGETIQQKKTSKGRENNKLQDFHVQEGSGECIWNISEQIQGQRCGLAIYAKDTSVRRRQGTHPSKLYSGPKNYFNHLGALAEQEDRI